MSVSKTDRPALILIDIQKAFDNVGHWGGQRNNLSIFRIKHCSSKPTSLLNEANEGNEFKDIVKPIDGEPIIKKNVNSAFIGTNLKELLDNANISKLVIVGLT